MKKGIKITLIVLASLFIVLIAGFKYMQYSTKKHSPEQRVSVTDGDLKIDIFYNSPAMRDRQIFGALVPYGEVWRTGANEPSTITFSQPVSINGTEVPAATYSLWTIPSESTWTVMLNSGEYGWGMSFGGVVPMDPALNVVEANVSSQALDSSVENFTISVEKDPLQLVMEWETTRIELPVQKTS